MRKIKMNKKGTIILLLVTVFVTFSFQSKFFEIAKQIEIYTTLFKELNMYYVGEINPAEITTKAITNTLKDLDPYTNFYNEQDVETAKIRRAGEYGGIGVAVFYVDKGIQIKEVYKGFAADKAGLKPGDIITFVDNQPLQNMNSAQLSMLLKGTPNSVFSVKIERQGQTFEKEITREKVIVNPVPFAEMVDEKTGYITLTRFNEKASFEVEKAYHKLKKAGMNRLILDLRYNPGGSLLESIRIANFFLPKGKTVVTTKAKIKKWSNTYKTKNDPLDLEIPIVVLINERSASASEIVSGSLQDYDRAVIMGNRSFGKGLVQRYRPLVYGTQLKVTISKYYTPSGRCIQELDYENRDPKTGKVPKFSDRGKMSFTTQNGRTVYDGGGVMPDVVIENNTKSKTTNALVKSKAIFNYATHYYYKNPVLSSVASFTFKNDDFRDFTSYLKTDTTFVTSEELLFKKAFVKASKNKEIIKSYNTIKEALYKNKIDSISKNKEIVLRLLTEEILERYVYKEGVYKYNLTNDKTISKAVTLLKDQEKYQNILSGK
ncbi:S41 family peptidase [Polaribacter tangerinus]|uniref:S41 family peptidase n=1 Tax=Polaribacter tangerinus TaxID=1920034 RepID=UPI000B4B856D|nr:S41 family peptidase [Polaribacter tangerinus]